MASVLELNFVKKRTGIVPANPHGAVPKTNWRGLNPSSPSPHLRQFKPWPMQSLADLYGMYATMAVRYHKSVDTSRNDFSKIRKHGELFSPLGKVAGRAIYFTDVFSIFFLFFLMVDFLALVAQTLMEQSSPKFQDW